MSFGGHAPAEYGLVPLVTAVTMGAWTTIGRRPGGAVHFLQQAPYLTAEARDRSVSGIAWRRAVASRTGMVRIPERRRLIEGCLSGLVLRLLGHRWPREIKAGAD